MSRKGMSLAVETVIVLVLAAAVLTALLYFFRSSFTPVETQTHLIQKQTELCQRYLARDPLCKRENFGAVSSSIPFGSIDQKDSLRYVCNKLYYEEYCRTGANNDPGSPKNQDYYCAAKCCASYGCNPPAPKAP